MAEGFLGASASSAGDDFHELWALQRLLEMLKPGSSIKAVTIEGVPADERHAALGERAQAVDVAIEREAEGQSAFHYAQLKFSPSHPDLAWTWNRLLAAKTPTKVANGVLGKLAHMLKGVEFAGSFAIVTNQPISEGVARDVKRLITNAERQCSDDRDLLVRLREGTGLNEAELTTFLARWELDGFGCVSRLTLETQILRSLGDMIDADARSNMMVMQQRVAALMLPENRQFGPVTRDTLLLWLGAGAKELLEPAPCRVAPMEPYLSRRQTAPIVQSLVAGGSKPLRISANGGCGKTSLVLHLPEELPADSEMIIYDCYGGGLFLSADDRRHLPENAFTQVGNELAFRLGTPFVIQKDHSARPIEAFKRRVRAAAHLIAQRSSEALLVLCFDAVDNSRIGARHWKENCFLDELIAVSHWPDNVRILVTCRNSRADDVGASSLYKTIQLPPFDLAEVEALLKLHDLRWRRSISIALHDLSGGIPRRVAYAIEGLKENQADTAIARLMPRDAGIDPLFERRAKEAGDRVGGDAPIWALMCILARCPRPIPADILENLSGLPSGGLRDVAADLGGIVEHPAGWSFHDEDFERFASERTADIAHGLMATAADALFEMRTTDRYAAFSLGEILMATGRLDQLYDLVRSPEDGLQILTKTERGLVHARRLALGLRCCAQSTDVTGACDLLIASAEASVRDTLISGLMRDNLDLAARFEPELTLELVLTNREHKGFRARCRVQFAAALAATEPTRAREHLRWWREEMRGAAVGDRQAKASFADIAAEFLAQKALKGLEPAIVDLLNWRPWAAQLDILETILVQGNFSPGEFEEIIYFRAWVPQALAALIAAALLSGISIREPWMVQAVERLGSARPTRWLQRRDFDLWRSGLFVGQEAALLICETAFAFPALHDAVRNVLRGAFPPPSIERNLDWHKLQSAGALHMRALALWAALEDGDIELETWLPPAQSAPAERDAADANAGKAREKAKDGQRRWNEARSGAINNLKPLFAAARQLLSLATASNPRDSVKKIITELRRPDYERRFESTDQSYILMRGALLAASCQGLALDPLLNETWPIFLTEYDNHLEVALDLAQWLAVRADNADLVAEKLVEIATKVEAFPAKGSTRAGLLMRCARIALRADQALARNFFERAVAATDKVDFEAISELNLVISVARQGIGGLQSEKSAIASQLGNLIGRLDESLGLRHDLPYGRMAGAIAAISLPTGLMALSQWHDRGILEPNYGLPEVLESRQATALTPGQRVALCITFDAVDDHAIELARGTAAFPVEVHDWLIGYALKNENVTTAETELRARGKQHADSTISTFATTLTRRLEDWAPEARPSPAELPHPQMIESREDLAAALQALHNGGEQLRGDDVEQLVTRVVKLTLRIPLLNELCSDEASAGALLELLPDILERWSSYPPVIEWVKQAVPGLIVERFPDLCRYDGEPEVLERVLDLLDLRAEERAALVLKAIVHNAEKLDPHQIFRLAAVVASGERPELRTALLLSLIQRVEAKADRPAIFDLGEARAPEDTQDATALLLFAMLGDPDKRVRWRASHAVRLLAFCGDPLLSRLVGQLGCRVAGSFVMDPFYGYAADQQLLLTLKRVALERPDNITPFADAILGHIRASTHLLAREYGRELLLHLLDQKAIDLDPSDIGFLRELNRPRPAKPRRATRDQFRGGLFRDRRNREFQFDETDTVPYWYDRPAGYLGMNMSEFLDQVETIIHGRWGFNSTTGAWLGEPRSERLKQYSNERSHRHGTHPRIEDLRRYLEWHGMLCTVGELIETKPVHNRGGYESTFDEWRSGLNLTEDPLWLSDLRAPAPIEPRFWGYSMPICDEDPAGSGKLPGRIFDCELQGEAGITVACDYVLRDGDENLSVEIRSALVTPETAHALAHALATAIDHMDFLLPGGDIGDPIDEPGFQLRPWLRFRHLEAGTDRPDPFRGAVSGVPIFPLTQAGFCVPQADPSRMQWSDPSGEIVLDTKAWGDIEASQHGYGWRTTSSIDYLTRVLRQCGMSMIFGVELRRNEHSDNSRKQWRMYVLNGDGVIVRVDPRRRHLGPVLLRKAGMAHTTDTLGRWMLHRIGDLRQQKLASSRDMRHVLQHEIEALCTRFQRQVENTDLE